MLLACATEGDDAEVSNGANLARLAHAVAVAVLPEREATKFSAGQDAVTVIIQCGKCVITVAPENPEGHVAEHLQPGSDAAGSIPIENEPPGVGRDPAPALPFSRAIQVEENSS